MPISLKSTGGGSITLAAPATASDYTLTFPAQNGTPITTQPSTAGNVLTSDGTNWVSQAPAATGAVTGDIVTSSLTSKSGYLKCDGSVYTRSSYSDLATILGTPLLPKNSLGNALAGYQTCFPQEANALIVTRGTTVNTSTYTNYANAISTSTDGITWTLRTAINPKSDPFHRVIAYGNSTYVLLCGNNQGVGNNPAVQGWMTSPDGATWTARSTNYGSNISLYLHEIAFGGTGNRFVRMRQSIPYTVVGCCSIPSSDSIILEYSSDGVTWTAGSTTTYGSGSGFGTSSRNHVVGYSGGFVSAFYNTTTSTNYVLYSADGVTWSDITSNINSVSAIVNGVTALSYVNSRFILMTAAGQIYTSTTGASGSWSLLTSYNIFATSSSNFTESVPKIWGNANAYATNYNGQVYLSNDLLSWLPVQNLGLGNIAITAVPSGSTRFFGTKCTISSSYLLPSGGAYYTDLYNYTTATQFPVPSITTYNTLSSPFGINGAPVNYFIKT